MKSQTDALLQKRIILASFLAHEPSIMGIERIKDHRKTDMNIREVSLWANGKHATDFFQLIIS